MSDEDTERARVSPDSDMEFILCVTHDVDRINNILPFLKRLVTTRDLNYLKRLVTEDDPYWRFGDIMELERKLGIYSSFYFLNEKDLFRDKSPINWIQPQSWSLYSYYNILNDRVQRTIQLLEREGWEVGLQGSYESYDDSDRLKFEKDTIENILGKSIAGGRQHYLNMKIPETWEHHQEIGLSYDSSLGSGTEFGFQNGYGIIHPFGDEFAVFPLNIMDQAIMEYSSHVGEIKDACDRVLKEAQENNAVMTIDWHQRTFDPIDFPGYREVYKYLIEKAMELGAWVGPVEEAYDMLIRGDEGYTYSENGKYD